MTMLPMQSGTHLVAKIQSPTATRMAIRAA